jgi:hypothetical protein
MIKFIVISLIKCNLFNGNIEYFSEIFFHMISLIKYAKRSLLLFDNNLSIDLSLVPFSVVPSFMRNQ